MSRQTPAFPPARSNREGTPVPDAGATAPWAYPGLEATLGYGSGFGGGAYALPPPPPPQALVAPARATTGRRELDDTNVYVARLPQSMTLEQFKELMERYGTVISSRLLEGDHWQTRGVRGVGFARMATPEEASKAIIGLNNKRLPGGSEPLQARLAFKKTQDGVNIAVGQAAFQPDLSWVAAPGQVMQWSGYGSSGHPGGYGGLGHQQSPGLATVGANGVSALMPGLAPQPGDFSGWTSGYYGHPYHKYYGGTGGSWDTFPSMSQQSFGNVGAPTAFNEGFMTGGEASFGGFDGQQQRQNVFCSPSDFGERPKMDVKTPEGGAVLNITGAATEPVSNKILNVVVEKDAEGARKPTTRVISGNNIVLCEPVAGAPAMDEVGNSGPASSC